MKSVICDLKLSGWVGVVSSALVLSACSGAASSEPGEANAAVSAVSEGADVLAAWEIRGDSPEYVLPATSSADGITPTELTRASAFARTAAYQDTFAAHDWPTENLDLNKYFEFGVEGSTVTLDHLEFSISSTNARGGSADWQIRSSVDDFGAAIAEGSVDELALPGIAVTPSLARLGAIEGAVTLRIYIFNVASDEFPSVGIRGSDGTAGSSLLLVGSTAD